MEKENIAPNENARPLTEAEKKRLEECQMAITAICQKYGVELVPRIVLEPAGVVFAQVGAKLLPQKSRIVVPKFQGPKGGGPA